MNYRMKCIAKILNIYTKSLVKDTQDLFFVDTDQFPVQN